MSTTRDSSSEAVPFKDFVHLNSTISLYRPPPPSPKLVPSNTTTTPPTLIILATWLGALPRHINKYTLAYQALFPSSPILVLQTTTADMVYRSYSAQQATLDPALLFLEPASQDAAKAGILLHMFSNAGAHQAAQLARAYRSRHEAPLQLGAMVFDSSPGVPTFKSTTEAMIVGLPRTPVLHQILSALVYVVVSMIFLQGLLVGGENLVERARGDLNDAELVRSRKGRLYVFSVKDRMVSWRDVESHGKLAEERGEMVQREKWVGSQHVGHMAVDGERYWGAVESLWKGGD